jgi:hypothetical protein
VFLINIYYDKYTFLINMFYKKSVFLVNMFVNSIILRYDEDERYVAREDALQVQAGLRGVCVGGDLPRAIVMYLGFVLGSIYILIFLHFFWQ